MKGFRRASLPQKAQNFPTAARPCVLTETSVIFVALVIASSRRGSAALQILGLSVPRGC